MNNTEHVESGGSTTPTETTSAATNAAEAAVAPPAPEMPTGPSPDAAIAERSQRTVRTGPIVWGALFLVCCAYMVHSAVSPERLDTATWVIATTIGLGVLLLAVGITVALRGRKR